MSDNTEKIKLYTVCLPEKRGGFFSARRTVNAKRRAVFSARRQKWAFKEGWLLKKTEKAGASVPRPFGVAVVKTKRRAAPFFCDEKNSAFCSKDTHFTQSILIFTHLLIYS